MCDSYSIRFLELTRDILRKIVSFPRHQHVDHPKKKTTLVTLFNNTSQSVGNERNEIIGHLQAGFSISHVARLFNMRRGTVSDLRRQSSYWINKRYAKKWISQDNDSRSGRIHLHDPSTKLVSNCPVYSKHTLWTSQDKFQHHLVASPWWMDQCRRAVQCPRLAPCHIQACL